MQKNLKFAWCYCPCARAVQCRAENVIDCERAVSHGSVHWSRS